MAAAIATVRPGELGRSLDLEEEVMTTASIERLIAVGLINAAGLHAAAAVSGML